MEKENNLEKIQKIAGEVGFDLVGMSPENPSTGSGQSSMAVTIDDWIANNYHADMGWMKETAEKRKDILKVIPEAKSVICVGMNYYGRQPKSSEGAHGRVARYAYGRDYHKIFDKKLKLFSQKLKDVFPENEFRCYCDTGPISERFWAVKAGLGFVGKNTNLITKYGSWVLLGEIVTDVIISNLQEVIGDKNTNTVANICGSCRRCLDACPTGALCNSHVVDSRKCISYLTIENKGEMPEELREKIGDRIFGCDVCQEVCPFNVGKSKEAQNELTKTAIAGSSINLREILSIKNDEEFLKRFAGSPVMRAKRRGLLRNSCVVAGNSGDQSLVPYLENLLNDNEDMVVSHARWAIKKLLGNK